MTFPFFIEPTWYAALQDELLKPYIPPLSAFVLKEYADEPGAIFPPQPLIFNALLSTPIDRVKVVLIGQDPYHSPGQAHGLSFSVPKGVPMPPSLKNIFKELKEDLGIPLPSHGSLQGWADQGVLLLNAILTVKKGEPASHHGRGWELFTDGIVRALLRRKAPVVFLLWGKFAQEKCKFLFQESGLNSKQVLMASHPSPYSADKGFFGCRHFSKTNELLIANGLEPIDWSRSL